MAASLPHNGGDSEQGRAVQYDGPERRYHTDPNYRGPEHRHPLTSDEIVQRVRSEPLTVNKIVAILTIYFFISQGVAQWRAQTVQPESFKRLVERVDSMASTVNLMATAVKTLSDELKEKKAGDNFFYYSICYSWKQQRSTTQYPAFCDRPEIQQFDPLGRAIIIPPRARP